MYKITKKFSFDSAHLLWDETRTPIENANIFGKCANLPCHGHTYFVEIELETLTLQNGMVRNFSELKDVFYNEVHSRFDHQFLNEKVSFLTSAENLAKYIYDLIKIHFPELKRVTVCETPTSSASYNE